MDFLPRDFEQLMMSKIRNGLSLDNVSSSYFFCIDNRMIFIKKSKRFYKIVCSSSCGFSPIYRESCLDVIYYNTDIGEVIHQFYDYVKRLVSV